MTSPRFAAVVGVAARRAAALAVVVAAALSGPLRAQAVPLPAQSAALSVGFASVGPPSFVADVALARAPTFQPLVQGRWDLHARSVAVLGGGAWEQSLGDVVFFRETALVGPFLATVDDVAVGARVSLQALAGFRLGDAWVLTVGPEVVPVVALDRVPGGALDGRVGCSLTGGARWFVVPDVAATLSVAAGYDVGGRGAGAVAGQAFAGALFVW